MATRLIPPPLGTSAVGYQRRIDQLDDRASDGAGTRPRSELKLWTRTTHPAIGGDAWSQEVVG